MRLQPRRGVGALIWVVAASVAVGSCNLDTTSPANAIQFAPAWKLQSIDGQALPDTLLLQLENGPLGGSLHEINAGAMEFFLPSGAKLLRWTLIVTRLTDSSRFEFSLDAPYVQFGADSIAFPRSRFDPAEFFGRRVADTLTVVTIWSGEPFTAALLFGGDHTWRFQRDTSVH